MISIELPETAGTYALHSHEPLPLSEPATFTSRAAYAAAHVVVDPANLAAIDWDSTLAFRRHLASLGFGIAEAMDTAQRGMGLDWPLAQELIQLSCAEDYHIACGANTDQLAPEDDLNLDRVLAAYQEQCAFIEACGGRIILMASRALARCAQGPDDYLRVYSRLLSQISQPVILHWLGEAFDPALRGYWGGSTIAESMEICLNLIHEHSRNIDGIKISLLDQAREIEMRRRLPPGVRMYTGDDFHYPELIEGDEVGHSDALLGIFDAIAPVASLAFQALDRGDIKKYRQWLEPTLALSRHIFQAPTYFYKTGLVFLAYLNGHQSHFRMLGGQESARSLTHLATLFRYADQARLLTDPELAVARMKAIIS